MNLIKNLLVFFISLIIGLFFIELILEFNGRYKDLSNQKLVLSDSIYEKPKSSNLSNQHPDLDIIVYNKIDSDGVRNHEEVTTSKKKNIIGMFGDSHTENVNIKNEFQFTTLLDKKFKEFNFVNYGIGGYSIDQIFIRYLKFQNHDIKKVYYIFSGNDAGSLISNNIIKIKENDEFEIKKPQLRLTQKLIGKLNLTYFFIDSYYNIRALLFKKHSTIDISNYPEKLAQKMYYNILEEQNIETLNNGESNLEKFNKILNIFRKTVINNGSEFEIIILPSKLENDAFEKILLNKNEYKIINLYKKNKEIIENNQTRLIFKNDSHYNEYGNLFIYQLILNHLEDKFELVNFVFEEEILEKINHLYGR